MFESSQQVAGHGGTLAFAGIFAKPACAQEAAFYESVAAVDSKRAAGAENENSNSEISVGDLLSDWLPPFYGTLTESDVAAATDVAAALEKVHLSAQDLPVRPTENRYLALGNLYCFYRRPSILDIKLGAVLTDEHAAPDKAERLAAVARDTTSSSHGFRICGMRVASEKAPNLAAFPGLETHVESTGTELVFNKWFGRGLAANVDAAIELFFAHTLPRPLLHAVLRNFHRRLQLLYNCVLGYRIRVVSGSLLLVLESDPAVWAAVDDYERCDPLVHQLDPVEDDDSDNDSDNDDNGVGIRTLSSLNLIDFAHAKFVESDEPDDNLLDGIENLIDLFGRLVDKHSNDS